MKIARVHLTLVRVPLKLVFVSSPGIRRDYLKTVVRLVAENGIVGIGETDGSPLVFAETSAFARRLLGCELSDGPAVRRALRLDERGPHRKQHEWKAAGGLEMAWWDAAAKDQRKPLHEMLGEKRRDLIPMVAELSAVPLEADAPVAEIEAIFDDVKNVNRVVSHVQNVIQSSGYRWAKLKSVGGRAEWDVRVMSALREAMGRDFPLRIDPNGAYDVETAIQLGKRLLPLGLQWLEDPAAGLEGLRQVRESVKTPVATNMYVIQFHHLEPAKRMGAVDIVGVDFFNWGGIANARELVERCRALGFRIFWHCSFDLGITTAATLHLAATCPEADLGVDTCLAQQEQDIIAGTKFRVEGGMLAVPEGHGLGVSLDEDAVSRFTVDAFEARL